MPAAMKWIILAVVLFVVLVPLYELFDRTDDWTQDSDLVKSVLYAFLFLGLPIIRRRIVTLPGLRSFSGNVQVLSKFPMSEQLEGKVPSEQCPLFLSLRDLRI
jgi:hypothetical protein